MHDSQLRRVQQDIAYFQHHFVEHGFDKAICLPPAADTSVKRSVKSVNSNDDLFLSPLLCLVHQYQSFFEVSSCEVRGSLRVCSYIDRHAG